jgi:hypothetical protein
LDVHLLSADRSTIETMRLNIPILRLLALCLLLAPLAAVAQDQEDNSPSLGDLARNLRKEKTQTQPQQPSAVPTVIDNDNLKEVMEDARRARPVKEDRTVFSIDPSGKNLKVSSPDVTCSLSFNSQATSLLIKPVLIEDLPLTDLLKIDGPGYIQD